MTLEQGNQIKHNVIEERDVYATMRDGVKIALDLFRPDTEGKFPALLSMSPYGKGSQSLEMPPQPPNSPVHINVRTTEAGDPRYFASKGYVHLIADMRGTGGSEGDYYGWMSKEEAQDGHDLVEWAAAQPWCDGNVGMVGISYFGTIQLFVAAEQPPHLKAIMPWNAVGDYYREATHHGGITQNFFYFLYQLIGAERGVSATKRDRSPEDYKQLVDRARNDPDLRMYPDLFNIVDAPGKNPGYLDILVNYTDGQFYQERSMNNKYDKVKIPSYVSSGWWAHAHMHLQGTFAHYAEIDAKKKIMIFPTTSIHPLPVEFNDEVLRWYDYWLKGIDTGIMNEPPVKIFVMGANRWRFENEWPLARTQWTKYYLNQWEGLSTEQELYSNEPDAFVQQPPIATSEINSVKYQTKPLTQDIEVTGPIALYLYASIDQDDTNFHATLLDVGDDGSVSEPTKGFLKASHRKLDEALSKPYRPYHSHLEAEPVVPGEVYEYAIELPPTSNVFKKGHRIKIDISSMDHPSKGLLLNATLGAAHHPWHVNSSKTTLHKVYRSTKYPSHLLLPVIPSES